MENSRCDFVNDLREAIRRFIYQGRLARKQSKETLFSVITKVTANFQNDRHFQLKSILYCENDRQICDQNDR